MYIVPRYTKIFKKKTKREKKKQKNIQKTYEIKTIFLAFFPNVIATGSFNQSINHLFVKHKQPG